MTRTERLALEQASKALDRPSELHVKHELIGDAMPIWAMLYGGGIGLLIGAAAGYAWITYLTCTP